MALVAAAAVAVVVPLAATPAGAVVDSSWAPAPGAVPTTATYAYIVSESGDFVGQGKTYSYDPTRTDIAVTVNGGNISLGIDGDQSWNASFRPGTGVTSLVKGAVYEDPGSTSGAPSVSFSGEGRSCSTTYGWYAIDDVTSSGGTVTSFRMRFELRCSQPTNAPMHGQIKWDANAPVPGAPTPVLPIPSLWTPAGGATPTTGPYLYMASQAGDFVGKGKTYLYQNPADFELFEGGGAVFRLDLDNGDDFWSVESAASNRADALTAGYYADLMRYPFHNPVVGGFDVGGNGAGCNKLNAWMAIDELDQRGGELTDVTMRFEQHCEGATPALRGRLHWEPTPTAGAPGIPTGVGASPVTKGAIVTWTAPASAGTSAITGYEVYAYSQGNITGPPVTVGASARSVAIEDLPVGVPHTFKVRAVNASGGGYRSAASAAVSPLDAKPVVTALSPASGIRTGGMPVSILGLNLAGASSVKVGGTSVPFTVWSNTRIDIVSPSVPAGTHQVIVTTPQGASTAGAGSTWTATKVLPGAPSNVAGTPRQRAIDVTWTAGTAGDDPLTGSTVTATKSGALSPQVTVNAAAGATSAAVTGLTPGTTYTIKVVANTAAGSSAGASSAPIAVPPIETGPFADVNALIGQQYLDFAGRPATSSEVTAAAAPINAGTSSPESFIAGMRSRAEWAGYRAPIIRLYAAYFDRLPDSGGLTYWANKLKSGTKLSKASSTFAASNEFKRKYGNLSNKDFVLLIYTNVLKRSPDTSGVNYWTSKLNAGMARGSVMTNFSESSENKRKTTNAVDVVLIYTGMLRRVPTAPELSAEVALLDGSTPLTDLVGRLLVSSAYEARF